MDNLLTMSSAPHIRGDEDTKSIMLDVVIALMPALIAGVYFFGYRALVVTLVTVLSAVIFEHLWCVLAKKPTTIVDLSAVVSGMILAMNLPATVPLWLPIVGSLFMIIIVKMCFGGIGQNFMNPAAAARAFLLASFPVIMTTWCQVFPKLSLINNVDVVTSATPLAIVKMGEGTIPSMLDLFFGGVGGCIGETSVLAILIGGIYLLCRKTINWKMPLVYIVTVGLFGYIFNKNGFFTGDGLYHMLSGGAMFAAVFMITDYTTSPVNTVGQVLFAFGAGAMTGLIRIYGGYPEGVTYGILLMNVAAPLLEKVKLPTFVKKTKGTVV